MLALLLRAGAVVALLAGLLSLLDERAGPTSRSASAPPHRVLSPKPPAAPRRGPLGAVTVAAVGDIVMGSAPRLPPDDGARFFSRVARRLRADVTLGNLEGTLSSGGSPKCDVRRKGCFAFRTPPAYARRLEQAGFTILNLANNHANDFGPRGEEQTIDALERSRLLHTGRPGEIAVERVGRLRVALIGFAPYPWAQSLTDIAGAKRLVRQAAARADVVVVTMHAGAEGVEHQHVTPGTETFLGESRGDVVSFSHAVIDAGADLVVGSGPHVLRGLEWYRRRLIAYSLGSFGGYGVFALGGALSTGVILRVTLRGDGSFAGGHLVATRLVGAGAPALDPAAEAFGLIRRLSRADFGSAGATVSSRGTIGRA